MSYWNNSSFIGCGTGFERGFAGRAALSLIPIALARLSALALLVFLRIIS